MFQILGLILLLGVAAAADRPLGDAAALVSDEVSAGIIVTGERIDGVDTFTLVGKPETEGTAPERRIFEIGSISKVFTALLLAQAIEDKRLTLETTLNDLLGDKLRFSDPRVASITLLQLSTHTSGLPRLPSNLGPNPDSAKDPYSSYDRTHLHDYLRDAKLPGKGPFPAAYSNLGVGLLGDLIAGVYENNWESLVKEAITRPLGMSDTVVTLNKDQQGRLAAPHTGAQAAHNWSFQALAGAGALRSTAADLLIFGQALLEPEKSPLAKPITSVLTPRATFGDFGSKIGLGILIGKIDGGPVYEHSGGTGGYRSMLQVLPDRKIVRVVLINNDSLPAERVITGVRDVSLPDAERTPMTGTDLDLFAGVYDMGPQTRFTVIRVGDELRVRLTGQPFLTVGSIGDDRFRYMDLPAEIQFSRDGDKIASLTLHQNGREILAKRSDKELPKLLFPKAADLQAFTGQYELAPDKILTLSIKVDTLFAQLTGQSACPVFSTQADQFEYDVVDARLVFERDKAGKVTGLVLHQNGQHRAVKRD